MIDDPYVSIFSVPLFHYTIKDWNKKKQDLLDIYESVISNISKHEDDTVSSDYFRSGSTNVSYWDKIEKILQEELQLFSSYTKTSYKQNGHWFERSSFGMHHEVHNHGAIGYSAVCYIEYDESYHTPAKFVSPFNNFFTGAQLVHTPENIKSGSILFFPSVIHHYTSPNLSERERIVLSFNLTPRS